MKYANDINSCIVGKNCDKKLNSKSKIMFEDFEEKLKIVIMIPQMLFTLPNGETFQFVETKNKF